MATCAEVSVTNGAVKVLRVVEAFECGAVVNPEHLRDQVEGAISMGLGGALFERVEFASGRIGSNRLSRTLEERDAPDEGRIQQCWE